MTQRTQCDRCNVITESNEQAYEIAVGPLRVPSTFAGGPFPTRHDKYLQLCHDCHVELELFLSMRAVQTEIIPRYGKVT